MHVDGDKNPEKKERGKRHDFDHRGFYHRIRSDPGDHYCHPLSDTIGETFRASQQDAERRPFSLPALDSNAGNNNTEFDSTGSKKGEIMMRRCMGCMREFSAEFDVCPYCGFIVGAEPESRNHLPPGTVLQERFMLGRVLGQGGFGITYIAWDDKLYRAVAVKEYLPTRFASRLSDQNSVSCFSDDSRAQFNRGLKKLRQECLTISSLREIDGVVQVYDFIEENDTAYIIMELLRGCTLRDLLAERGTIPLDEAVEIMRPVLNTLAAMHEKGVIHRDVSPDNIFVCDDGRIKLLDFGAARVISATDDKTISVILKHGYAPREQFASHGKQGPYTDVYSAAATLYKLLTGETPPESIERTGNDRTELAPLMDADIPRGAKTAILQAMRLDKDKRTQSAQALLAELEPFAQTQTVPVIIDPQPGSRFSKRIRILCGSAAILLVAVLSTAVAVHYRNKPEVETTTETARAATTAMQTGLAAFDDWIESETTLYMPETTLYMPETADAAAAPTTETTTAAQKAAETVKAWDAGITVVRTQNITHSGEPDLMTDDERILLYYPQDMRIVTDERKIEKGTGFSPGSYEWYVSDAGYWENVKEETKYIIARLETDNSICEKDTGFISDAKISEIKNKYPGGTEEFMYRYYVNNLLNDGQTASDIYKMKIGKRIWFCVDSGSVGSSGEAATHAFCLIGHYIHYLAAWSKNGGTDESRELLYRYVDTA